MLFFLISLLLCLALSGALLAALSRSLQINWDRKNRRPISYLCPVLLTLIFLALTIFLTIPRILDTVPLLTGGAAVEDITVLPGDLGWNTLYSGGRRFTYNQWQYPLQSGRRYQIFFAPSSRVIVEIRESADQPGTP